MKKLVFILVLGLFFQVNGQIPSKVINNFKTRYPRIENEVWSIVEGKHHARFEHLDQSKIASYEPDGSWIQTVVVIEPKELMFCISDYIGETYPKYKTVKAALIVGPNNTVKYSAVIELENINSTIAPENLDSIKVMFNQDCKLLSTN